MSKVAPPTEEVVKALLDYLVDPMLPLKASNNNPPSLSNQQSVAKQMHAVVLLYNYYQRKKHPELRFLECEPFCQLALNLKPGLIAHMSFDHQSETLSKDLRNQLSMTEKAVMDACNISLSLDSSRDVPNSEAWPIAKVSVLLVDSKKENCVLLYSSITDGVWSVIEEYLDVSDLDSEIRLEGTASETMRVGKRSHTDAKDAKGSGFEHLAFAAVKKATGIHHSELMVLERHVVHSLTKEKTASYFYIMQYIQSSKDFEVPIKDVIESLQGPLLKWISGSWTLTQVVEYYNVLPYAMIMSSWYSREVISNGSESLDARSFETGAENCSEKIAESEQAVSNDLQNFSVGLGNIDANSSSLLEDASVGELSKCFDIHDQSHDDVKSRGNEAIADEIFKVVEIEVQEMQNSSQLVAEESSLTMEKEAQEMITSDKSCDVTHPTLEKLENSIGAHCSGRKITDTDISKLRESESEKKEKCGKPCEIIRPQVKQLENCIDTPCNTKETIDSENCKMVEIQFEETEKSDKSLDTTNPTSVQLEIGAYCKETASTVNYAKGEKEVEPTENFDKLLDINSSAGKHLENDASNMKEVEQIENFDKLHINHSVFKRLENDAFNIGEGIIFSNNSKRLEKEVEDIKTSDTCSKIAHASVKELRNSINANCRGKEAIGDNTERIEKLVEDTKKSDECLNAVKLTVNKRSSNDLEDSELYPTNNLQIIHYPPRKRQKMDLHGLMMNSLKNKLKNKNAEVPIRVYHHLKRKIALESGASTSVIGAGIYGRVESYGPWGLQGRVGKKEDDEVKLETTMIDSKVEIADASKSLSGKFRGQNTENCINGSIQPNLNGTAVAEYALVSTLAKKDVALTETALGVLLSKRAKLCHQQRTLQDEVALCDRKIQKILEGKEDALALKLDVIIDGCKDMLQREDSQCGLSK